ncbi:hypothetical protein Tco_0429261 [Tanacetum coccineum]
MSCSKCHLGKVDAKLNFVEEPVEILEREIKKLRWSRIPIIKVKRMLIEGVTKPELTKLFVDYDIPSEFNVMLPKSNQTIYDALLNPFGCAELITFVVMCKAYGDEPSVDLFRGFFNLYTGVDWLTFFKRPEADCLARHPDNVQYFSDPILFFAGLKTSWEYSPQHPVIFLGGKELAFRNFMFAKDDEEMSFLPCERSLGFGGSSPSASINNEPPLIEVKPLDSANPDQLVENTADSGGSLVHEEMTVVGNGSVAERMKNWRCRTKGSVKPPTKSWQLPVLFPGSSAKSPLRLRLSCPPTLRSSIMKLTIISYSFACISFFIFLYLQFIIACLPDALELGTIVDCHLMISYITPPAWRGHNDYQSEVELLDLYDRCYARQAMVGNAVNWKARELLKMVD